MEPDAARTVARRLHAGQLTRAGAPLIEHVERVAGAVPDSARALAYLHDLLERSTSAPDVLSSCGLTHPERQVLDILTREPGETYAAYVNRIARAGGDAGRLARIIKLADLDDHLSHRAAPGAPDYRWARRQIAESRSRRGEGRERRSSTAKRAA